MIQTQFSTYDKKKLALFIWDEVENPRLVVQILHGMCEHSGRYDRFARFLNQNGIIVAMTDQRGHGKSADENSYGYDDGNMWENNLTDQVALSRHLQTKYDLPLVLFGHSYGSFLAQRLMQIDPVPVAFVLSGSCYMNNIITKAGALISLLKAKSDPKAPGKVMADMSFKAYEKMYPGRNNWLSTDVAQVELYNSDPACGFVASNAFYSSFLNGLKKVYKKANQSCTNINRPIYIFSGKGDPVGKYGKGVVKLYNYYKKCGIKDVTMKLYPNGRHEMLNEVNKDEVFKDCLEFLKRFFAEEKSKKVKEP